jgi:hypothetical protein
LGVEADSFFPEEQRDRSDLARQGQASHLRPDSIAHQSRVKLLERPGLGGGDEGCALEDVFEIVIVIAVQPPLRYLLLRWLQGRPFILRPLL